MGADFFAAEADFAFVEFALPLPSPAIFGAGFFAPLEAAMLALLLPVFADDDFFGAALALGADFDGAFPFGAAFFAAAAGLAFTLLLARAGEDFAPPAGFEAVFAFVFLDAAGFAVLADLAGDFLAEAAGLAAFFDPVDGFAFAPNLDSAPAAFTAVLAAPATAPAAAPDKTSPTTPFALSYIAPIALLPFDFFDLAMFLLCMK